jgi:putative endonuclease
MDERKVEGLRIEGLVAQELQKRGYRIVVRNYTKPWGELDIVARKGREIVVCEVRSRSSGCFEDAADTVGHTKRDKIRRTTQTYLEECQFGYDEVRFFVAAAVTRRGETKIELFEDAF